MNIKATNSTAVSKVTADIKIKYRMSTRGTEAVKMLQLKFLMMKQLSDSLIYQKTG